MFIWIIHLDSAYFLLIGAGLLHHVKQFKEVAQRKVPEKENDSKMEDLAGQVHCKLSELTQAEAEGMLPQVSQSSHLIPTHRGEQSD